MTPEQDEELEQAADGLIRWFQSQNVGPSKGACVMIKLLCRQIVTHAIENRNVAEADATITDSINEIRAALAQGAVDILAAAAVTKTKPERNPDGA